MTKPATRSTLTQHGPAVRNLARRWLARVAEAPEVREGGGLGDFACSPVGLWLALSAVAAGAEGETAEELRAALGTAGPAATEAVTGVSRALAETDALAVATGVWSRTPVYRAFRETLPDLAFGPLDPEDTVPIDDWIREATQGLVTRLPLAPTEDALLLLVNALVLKARWERPFDANDTEARPFTDAAGAQHQVPTMRGTVPTGDVWSVPLAAERPDDEAGRPGMGAEGSAGPDRATASESSGSGTGPGQRARGLLTGRGRRKRAGQGSDTGTVVGDDRVAVVELRCRPGAEGGPPAVVRLLLGPPGEPAARVLPAAWAGPEVRAPVDASRVRMTLPRLSLRTRLDVTPQLAALGIQAALRDDAGFPHLSPEPLRIEQVGQESVLRIAEKGVEAAAATEVIMWRAGSAAPPRPLWITFDRPFGIVVLDAGGTVPLFTAWQASAPRGPEPDGGQ